MYFSLSTISIENSLLIELYQDQYLVNKAMFQSKGGKSDPWKYVDKPPFFVSFSSVVALGKKGSREIP